MIIINIFNDYMYNIDIIIKSSLGGIILFEELKTFVAVVEQDVYKRQTIGTPDILYLAIISSASCKVLSFNK